MNAPLSWKAACAARRLVQKCHKDGTKLPIAARWSHTTFLACVVVKILSLTNPLALQSQCCATARGTSNPRIKLMTRL